MKNKQFVIIGCPRSATGYASKFFQHNGLQVGHEILGKHGISSWCIVPGGDHKLFGPSFNEVIQKCPENKIYHQVRNPVDTINSLMTISKQSMDYIASFISLPETYTKLQKCMLIWMEWNRMAEEMASTTYFIEDINKIFWGFCPYRDKKYNHRDHPEFTAVDLKNEDYTLFTGIEQYYQQLKSKYLFKKKQIEMKKILVVIASYGKEQLGYLQRMVEEFRSFRKYNVTIVVNSDQMISIPGVNRVNVKQLDNYQLLPLSCRETIWNNKNKFDLYIFSENDHLFREHHIDKFLEYNDILPSARIAGLLQYEEYPDGLWFPAFHASYGWDANSVEEYGGKLFAHFTNIHQASFIITNKQLMEIGAKYPFGSFFEPSHYSQKCKTNTDIYQFCGMKKVICISELTSNIIHHMPNIYKNGENNRLKLGSHESKMFDEVEKIIGLFKSKHEEPQKEYLVETMYRKKCEKKSDINEHLPVLRKYASECSHITEFGVRGIVSTWAFLAGKPKKFISYDIIHPSRLGADINQVYEAAMEIGVDYNFKQADVLKTEIEETELLFIDTIHNYEQLKAELELHATRATKYIILHDTTTFGINGMNGKEGLKKALNEFLEGNLLWSVENEFKNNNGLTILKNEIRKPNDTVKQAEDTKIIPINKDIKYEVKMDINPGKKVKFIIPYPDVTYYNWMVLVQINNFRKMGYDVEAHYPVCIFNGTPSKQLMNFIQSDKIKSKFFLYADVRPNEHWVYTASIKPFLMAQYFSQFPQEKNSIYVLLDPDVIFLKHLDFSPYLNDNIWYESNSRSYLDSKYIKSKGEQLFIEMCQICKIPPKLVEFNDDNCGGAQYITKNNTANLWYQAYLNSIPLYNHMVNTKDKYMPKGPNAKPIQAWCSEMWSLNYALWMNNIKTQITPGLDFHWANHMMKDKKHAIYHNAGVFEPTGKHFHKVSYQSSPFKKNIKIDPYSLSNLYLKEIKETEINFPELIWD